MILVFKTNVLDTNDVLRLSPLLDESLKQCKWNFDLDDRDKILRIDASGYITHEVTELLEANGFRCEELTD